MVRDNGSVYAPASSPFECLVGPPGFGYVIPVIETQLAASELLGVLVDEVPPTGQGNARQYGPLKSVKPTEGVALESAGGLPPRRGQAGRDENSELDVKGECPA